MKILIAAPHYPPRHIGGTELIAHRMAHALHDKGHDVSVVSVESIQADPEEPFCHVDNEDGVKVYRLNFQPTEDSNFFQFAYSSDPIYNWVKGFIVEEQPDIVHLLSGYLITGSVLEAAYACQTAVVVTLLDFWFVCPRITLLRANGELCAEPVPASRCAWCLLSRKRRFRVPDEKMAGIPGDAYTFLGKTSAFARILGAQDDIDEIRNRRAYLKKMLEQADVVITHSHFLQEKVRDNGIFTDNVVYLPNGIDYVEKQFSGRDNNARPLKIGYIGQIARHKGVHVLIDAFNALDLEKHNAELHIYGDTSRWPDYTQSLQEKAAHQPAISFDGTYPADEVARVLDNLDVLVVPSIWFENRPTVIMEAFSRKKPVIVSDLGGMAEMVQHEVDGLRFSPGDVDSLSKQLQRILDNPGELDRLAAGIQPVKTAADEMDEIERLYEKVIKQRQQMQARMRQ